MAFPPPAANEKRRRALISALLLSTLLGFGASFALPPSVNAATGINKQINVQGKVVNANGTNVANGNYDFVFSMYTVATAGTAIWTETRTAANQVAVTDGIFRVSLGSLTALPGSIDFNTDNIYLGVTFNNDGEMTPRVQFTAVPQAFNARTVGGLTVTDTTGTLTIPSGKTVSFADAFTTSGANPLTLTTTATTNATLPTGTITLVDLAASQTLTNKTIGSTGLVFSGASTDIDTAAGEALTLQGRTNSVFTTTAGTITLQPAGSGTISTIQIGAGGAGSTTPDFLGLDVKSDTGDPAGGVEGAMYYNTLDNKFRCFQGAAWTDCIGAGGSTDLQVAYANGNAIITTDNRNIAFTLADTTTDSNLTITTATGATGQTRFILANGAGTTPPNELILIDQQDTNLTLANGITVQAASGGVITDAIDLTSAGIVNALNVADNTILGATAVIDFTNFDVSGAGAITGATYNGLTLTSAADGLTVAGGTTSRTLTVTGANITVGSTIQPTSAGALTVQANGSNALTVTGGAASTWSTSGASSTLILEAGATTANTALTLRSANQSAGSTNSGGVTVASGNAAGATSTAGDILLDVGTSTTGNGSIKIGTAARAQTIAIGNTTGGTITVGQASGSDLALNDAQWSVTGPGAATFTSVTSPTHTGSGAVTVSSGGSSALTLDSASGDITVAVNDGLTFAATTLGNNGSRNVTINSGTGGTTATLVVKLDTSGTVVTTDTTTLNNAVGVALNTTTIGQAVRVAINGVVTATADNAVTAGDYIGLGTTTAGRAKSLGTTYPATAGVQVIGRALGTQATPGSTFLLMLNGLENNVAAGGGGGYNLIKEETTSLTARTTLAFLGTAVTCADNAGLSQTECTVSGAGGGVSFASGVADNTVTSNNLIHLQKSGVNRFVVANSGGVTISAGTSDTVKTTTGTTLATDFSLTGSTLTNVTSANDLISINDGSVTNTMSTSLVVTSAAAGAGAQTILREDGQYIIIHGNSLATGSRWDGSATTMTSVTVATGAVNPGAGAIALKRPDGRYLIVHGNSSLGLTSLFDPWGVTVIAAGPAVCGAAAATTGTNAFLRPDGNYVILCGGLTAWGVYNPTTNVYTAGTAVALAFGAGAHALQRDDGTFLVFRGGTTTTHWIYNPFASAVGTMTQDPIVTTPPTISTGAFSIRRADGKFLVMGGAVNASTIYDPTRTSVNSGAGTMTPQTVAAGFGPTAALADGAQSLWRQDRKYLLITGNTTTTNVIDPSKTDSTQFVAGPALNAAAAAGIHAVIRPDGGYQIIRGGATTTTDIYNTGFVIGGAGSGSQLASYETECITATSLNASSTLIWTGNAEGRMWFQAKTGTGACSGAYKDIKNSGDLINPVAGDNRVQMKVFFQRDMPKFADQEWGLRRGLGQTRYRRTNKDPALYDVSVDNSTSFHRSQFEFGNSSDPSGPVMVNLTNNSDRNLAIALEMGVGYGSTINATNPQFYNGAFGTHTALATSATAGTVVMRRPDGKFMVVAGNTVTANAQLYDPVAQTFTAQAGAGNIPTAGTGLGALAIKRPNETYLMLVGNAGTATNIYNPLGASGSQFVAGPALTAAAGRGALVIPLPNGRVLILHGNFTNTSSIYDPFQNTMVAGPISSAVIGGGAMAIPRSNGTYFVVLGVATEACTALNTTTNNFDPYTMVFTAAGSPAITTGVGPGAFAFQRSDGYWVIVHGGGTITTCAGTTRTQIYNPITNQSIVGPVLSGVAQNGAHAIQRPDGTWLIVHAGAALTTTSIYLEKTGGVAALTNAVDDQIGAFIAGPALVTGAGAGSISFQRDDGKFVTITGNAGLVVQQYDGGWISNGTYRSEALNIADLDSSSALVWQGNADVTNISAEVKTATSKDTLQIATSREIPTSGGLINPSASEVWMNVNFNFKRTFPSYGGIYTDTWYNGGSPIQFAQRKMAVPTLNEFKITKDVDLINLKTDGLSVFRVNSGGDIYTSSYGSFNAGGADLAENYASTQTLEAGEVVMIDRLNSQGVIRSTGQYQSTILGVVSTAPGFVAGAHTKDAYPVALVGRVPVKVSAENGPIRSGDLLTSASIPGYAMRATLAGRVMGKALEDLTANATTGCPPVALGVLSQSSCGTILMFVNLGDSLGMPLTLAMAERAMATTDQNAIGHDLGLSLTDTSGADVATAVHADVAALVAPSPTVETEMLTFLRTLKAERESMQTAQRSEVVADRVSAVFSVLSPTVITDTLVAKEIHAGSISADQIRGIEVLTNNIRRLDAQVAGLSTERLLSSVPPPSPSAPAVSSFVATSTDEPSPSAPPSPRSDVELGNVQFRSARGIDLQLFGTLHLTGALTVVGPVEFQDTAVFHALAKFAGGADIDGPFVANGHVTLAGNSAGYARVLTGARSVTVSFTEAYEMPPLVSVSLMLDEKRKDDGALEDLGPEEEAFLANQYTYLVSRRSARGFTVVLNKPASESLTFAWFAIGMKDPTTVESAPVPTPLPALSVPVSPATTRTSGGELSAGTS